MIDYIYEVRFPHNPDPSFTQKFSTKQEAVNCSQEYPGSEVYMLELDYDDFGTGNLVSEIQISGPEMDAVVADPNVPDSCEGDACRMPKLDDDLDDEDVVDYLVKDEEEAIDGYDRAAEIVEDPKAKEVFAHIKDEEQEHIDELRNIEFDDEDMSDEELGEALFGALNNSEQKIDEDAAGVVDDPVEGEENCAWCGEAIPVSSLKFEKNLGYICDRCQAAIASHEGDDALEL